MRYLPSESNPSADPSAEEELFDPTDQVAMPAGKVEKAAPYEPVTPQLARNVGQSVWKYIDPRANGAHRLLAAIAMIVVAAFPVAWTLSWLLGLVPIPITAGAFALGGIVLGWSLLAAALRTGDDLLFGRVHLGLLVSGAMAMAGWLPPALLVTVIGPGAIGYGFGAFGALFVGAARMPSRLNASEEAVQDQDMAQDETLETPAQPSPEEKPTSEEVLRAT